VRVVLWAPAAFAWLSLRTGVALAGVVTAGLLLLLVLSMRRGPLWWKFALALALAIGVASAAPKAAQPESGVPHCIGR